MKKQEFLDALKTDRLYGIDVERGFKMLCADHNGLEDALDSGNAIRDGNDIWNTNGSKHHSQWELLITINTKPYSN